MRNRRKEEKLIFPVSRQPFPEPRELSMDDYYEFVVSNLALFGKPPQDQNVGYQRFVIRDKDETWPAKKDLKKDAQRAKVQLPGERRSRPSSKGAVSSSFRPHGTRKRFDRGFRHR